MSKLIYLPFQSPGTGAEVTYVPVPYGKEWKLRGLSFVTQEDQVGTNMTVTAGKNGADHTIFSHVDTAATGGTQVNCAFTATQTNAEKNVKFSSTVPIEINFQLDTDGGLVILLEVDEFAVGSPS